MAYGTTPKPSELIRAGAAKFPDAGVIYTGLAEFIGYSSPRTVRRISALGALYAGAGYDLENFDQNQANNVLFDGWRAWVSGLGRELPIADAIADLMSHEKWGPEDVALYLEKNLGL